MCKRKWTINQIEYFGKFWESRGRLFPINFDELPFTPQRIFIVDNIPNCQVRGKHAHKTCEQTIFCLSGEVWVINYTYGEFRTNKMFPGQALYIPPMMWSSQIFYEQGSILVFASKTYDETDYIRNFEEYLEMI